MCGLVGVARFQIGGIYGADKKMFEQSLVADAVRGIHGTGIARVLKDGKCEVRKQSGNPFDLFRSKDVYKWLESSVADCDRILFGHNRWASSGTHKKENAHPFRQDHLIVAHNGGIWNLRDLSAEADKFEVDSNGLTYLLAKNGIIETLKEIRGAYALIMYDEEKKHLFLARNHARPLWYAYDDKRHTLMFGSEPDMMRWIVGRNNEKDSYKEFVELPTHELFEFDFDGKLVNQTKYEPPTTTATTYYQGGYEYEDDDYMTRSAWERVNGGQVLVPRQTQTEIPFNRKHQNKWDSQNRSSATIHAIGQRRLLEQEFFFPQKLYGYTKGDKIQFVGVSREKTGSGNQDQWRVNGLHPNDSYKMEIQCFVKGKDTADALLDCHYITATVRGLERRKLPGGDVEVICFVSHPQPEYGGTIAEQELVETPAPATTESIAEHFGAAPAQPVADGYNPAPRQQLPVVVDTDAATATKH